MSREVSVEDAVATLIALSNTEISRWRVHDEKYRECLVLGANALRRSVLLERVAEESAWVASWARGRQKLADDEDEQGGEEFSAVANRLEASLSALRDHDKLGKEG